MPAIDEAALKQHIRDKAFAPVYVLYGDDVYLKQQYARKIASKIAGKDGEFAVQRFSGEDFSAAVCFDAVSTPPLTGGDKCVLVCDWDPGAAGAQEQKAMKELLSEPFEGCTLVFWFDAVELDPKKSAKHRDFLAAAGKLGCGVQLDHPDAAALARILCDGAARRGCHMHTTTARRLAAVCGSDLQSLMNELEKLAAFAGGGEITPAHIDALCAKNIDTPVWALAKALTGGRGADAFAILGELYEQRVEPVAILSALSGSYVDIYRAKAAAAAGKRPADIAQEFGYRGREFRLKNAAPLASKLSLSALRHCVRTLAQADGSLKSSRTDSRVVIEQTMQRLLLAAKGEIL